MKERCLLQAPWAQEQETGSWVPWSWSASRPVKKDLSLRRAVQGCDRRCTARCTNAGPSVQKAGEIAMALKYKVIPLKLFYYLKNISDNSDTWITNLQITKQSWFYNLYNTINNTLLV